MDMFQSNIYYYVRNKKVYCVYKGIVSTQEILVHAQDSCARTRVLCVHKSLVHAQDSCTCTTFLCMHNTLVHTLEGPGSKAGTQQKSAAPGRTLGAFCLGPALGPWPLQCMHCAFTKMLCMHKNLVRAQES